MIPILLVEDDANLAAGILRTLEAEGFRIEHASSLAAAHAALSRVEPRLILLDWMLPDGQGIDFLHALRAAGGCVPILLLTARSEVVDRVLGLEIGANDYITKPFDPRELIARIRAHLRMAVQPTASRKLAHGEISLDLDSRLAYRAGRTVETTKMEFELLRTLLECPNRVFSREELLNEVWGYENFPTTRTVDTHVLQLRSKFGDAAIETVRGVGYRLKG